MRDIEGGGGGEREGERESKEERERGWHTQRELKKRISSWTRRINEKRTGEKKPTSLWTIRKKDKRKEKNKFLDKK